MDKYEILYIIRGAVEDDQKLKTVDKFAALAESLGATVESVDKWGMRKFAYEIDKQFEGYYVLMNIVCTSEAQEEINRQMRNDECILRQMIIKK